MAFRVMYADGRSEIINEAVKVDYNYYENTYDFCDKSGQPLLQLVLDTGITWTQVEESAAPAKN